MAQRQVPLSRAPLDLPRTPVVDQWYTALVKAVNDLLTGTQWGSGDPETVVFAPQGTIFRREDGAAGSTLYYKSTGGIDPAALTNTGWVALP